MKPPRAICYPCRRAMVPDQNGISVAVSSNGMIVALFDADRFRCPSCGQTILIDFGVEPWKQRSDEGFTSAVGAANVCIEM